MYSIVRVDTNRFIVKLRNILFLYFFCFLSCLAFSNQEEENPHHTKRYKIENECIKYEIVSDGTNAQSQGMCEGTSISQS